MTDSEEIEKLAKWMGWKKISCKTGKSEFWYWTAPAPGLVAEFHEIAGHDWNPRANLADAWMLVRKLATSPSPLTGKPEDFWPWATFLLHMQQAGCIYSLSASQLANAIVTAVLKAIATVSAMPMQGEEGK